LRSNSRGSSFDAPFVEWPREARRERERRRVSAVDLAARVRDVPDFPEPGIVFKDIMPLLADPAAFRDAVDRLGAWAALRRPELILGAEARGFILGGALAYKLGCGFCAARRPGKLPAKTVSVTYALEYGENSLEVHADAFANGARVLVHDDVLATGGTVKAILDLVEQLGGEVVGVAFLIELEFLNGREKLQGFDVHSLISY
jgi:adenine phosphoribosyltransferase